MLIRASQTLAATSPATATAGADAQLIGLNTQRNGLRVSVDSAAASPVYLLVRSGVASATNFDVCLAAGAVWDGKISDVVWCGAVRFFSAAGGKVGVLET